MLRKALLLVSGNAFGSAMLLVRNLAVARLVSVENYGIAATFAMGMAIVELMSQFGLHQLIVQDKNGDDPRMQAGLQGFNVLRGLIAAAAMFLLAGPFAAFMGVPEVAWAYQVIAVIPVLNALVHFDMHRMKRQMKFLPSVLITAVPALLSVVAVWPLYLIYGDYQVMLYALIVQAFFQTVLSHLLAERPYRLSLERDLMAHSMRFGWPLLLNGILLFAMLNGEKVIVGHKLGMADLAIFSMGFTLTLTPTLILATSAQSFFLPQLSAVQQNPTRFATISYASIEASLAIGVLLVIGTVLLGPPIANLLLGANYAGLLPLLAPLALVQAIRICKTGSATVALAKAQTGNALIANLFRVASLPISFWIAATTGSMLQILWVAAVAELLGFAASMVLLRGRVGLSLRPLVLPSALTLLTFGAMVVVTVMVPAQPGLLANLHPAQLAVVLPGLAALAVMRHIWGFRERPRS